MKNFILFILLIVLSISCNKEIVLDIKSQEDLDEKISNSYIKVAYNSESLDLKKCDEFTFEFKDVEVIKLSKSDFTTISEGLINSKLNSVQNVPGSDFYLEYRGYKFCVNHLGNVIRNNRRMNDDLDLVHLIKSKSKYYNQFSEDELNKKDTLVSKLGLPFSHDPSDLTLNNNLDTKKNIILTY